MSPRGVVMLAALIVAGRGAAMPPEGRAQRAGQGALFHLARAWPVMGTMLTVEVWGSDTAAMLDAIRSARDSVRLVDSLMSRYRPESEISRINVAAAAQPQRVSPQTMHVLLQARVYWRLSGGAFDPTVGPLTLAWEQHGQQGREPPARAIDSLRRLVGYDAVQIDTIEMTVRLPERGMQLDLGGIAKGYALDLARLALLGSSIGGGSVNLGGNVLMFGRPPAGRRWRVAVVDPCRPRGRIGELLIDSGAVATSGNYEHYYRINGRRYGHLIDPRTGRPAHGVLSATVVGPRGEWSDGLSAALFLVGPARGAALADSLSGIAAVWVRDGERSCVRRRDVIESAGARNLLRLDSAARGR